MEKELFNEVYGLYYQIMGRLLTEEESLTIEQLTAIIHELGFEETILNLLPQLVTTEGWHLLYEEAPNEWHSLLLDAPKKIQTSLEKAWLKSILLDEKINLFLSPAEKQQLLLELKDVPVLFHLKDLFYYDQFKLGDAFNDNTYQEHFKTLITALTNQKIIEISYQRREKESLTIAHYIPLKLEYSKKNNKFRLQALKQLNPKKWIVITLNLSKIKAVTLTDSPIPNQAAPKVKEKMIRCLIHDQRNAMERAMLHFSDYRKETLKLTEEDCYEMKLYYPYQNETEVLIEILSFGPMIQVLEPQRFIDLIKRRIQNQWQLDKASMEQNEKAASLTNKNKKTT